MGEFLKNEARVANMPRIRVQPKSTRHKPTSVDFSSNFQMAGKQMHNISPMVYQTHGGDLMSLRVKKDVSEKRKPRINYELLIAKA